MNCCKKPEIASFDFRKGSTGEQWVNKLCLHCETHWYGQENDVTQYTKQEWNAYINDEGSRK